MVKRKADISVDEWLGKGVCAPQSRVAHTTTVTES